MTPLATSISKMIFDLILKKLQKLEKEKIVYNLDTNFPQRNIISFSLLEVTKVVTSSRFIYKNIFIFFYRDTGRISVQLLGSWLSKCKVTDKYINRFVSADGILSRDEIFWNLLGDPEDTSNRIIDSLKENVFPLHSEGHFKACYSCPLQLECLANKT